MEIVIVRSKVTGHWGYCPRAAMQLLRLDMDDKPTGYSTAEDALDAARRDVHMPKGTHYSIERG